MEEDLLLEGAEPLGTAEDVSEQSAGSLNVVMAYQDELTLHWAQEAYSHLVREVGHDAVRCSWYKSDELLSPKALADAAAAAADADMVLVAVRDSDPLHPGFKAWADAWQERVADHQRTLMVLLGRSTGSLEQSGTAGRYLRQAAIRGGLDYVTHEVWMSGARPGSPGLEPHVSGGLWPLGAPPQPLGEASWGINE